MYCSVTEGLCLKWSRQPCWRVFCFCPHDRYFIFTSFWAYKIYYVYGFMMLVLVILCIVTVCVTIVCTYFLLNAEDYRWWVFFPHGFLEYQPQNWGIVILSSILILVCLSLSSRQWTSFLSAASTAVYVYMYSFYYYFFKTKWVLLFINPMKHPVVEVLTSYTPLTFQPVVFQDVWAVPDILLLWLHGCV